MHARYLKFFRFVHDIAFDAGGILALIGLRIDGKQNQFHSNIDGFKRNRLDYILIINLWFIYGIYEYLDVLSIRCWDNKMETGMRDANLSKSSIGLEAFEPFRGSARLCELLKVMLDSLMIWFLFSGWTTFML